MPTKKNAPRPAAVQPAPPRRKGWLFGLLLIGACWAVFGPVLHHDFVDWDDDINVYDNPYLTPLSLKGIQRFWEEPYQKLYIPVTYSAWALIARLSRRLDPGGARLKPKFFHAANLLLHGLNVLLVFLILRILLDDDPSPERKAPAQDWGAFVGALLFAVHPIQVEPVAWISGMKDLLSGFFALLSMWQYLRFARGQKDGSPGLSYILATLCFLLATLAKPAAVVLPLLLAVMDFWILNRGARDIARALGFWFLLAAAWTVAVKSLQPDQAIRYVPPLWKRPLVAGDALSFYLAKLLCPMNLAPDYGRTPDRVLTHAWAYLAWLAPMGLAVWAWTDRKRSVFWPSLCLFVAGVAPVLGLVPFNYQNFSTVADRYLYLSLLGPALAAAWLITRRRLSLTIAGIVLAILAGRSRAQTAPWQDTAALFEHTLAVTPESGSSYLNLGYYFGRRGAYGRAMELYARLLRLEPDNGRARNNLGNILLWQGRLDEALAEYNRALKCPNPADVVDAENNVGVILARRGDADGAALHYEQALRLDPAYSNAHNNLALILEGRGQLREAVAHYRRAVELRPNYAEARVNLACALAIQGHWMQARKHFALARGTTPDLPALDNDLGFELARRGRFRQAVGLYRKAIQKQPGFLKAWANLGNAWLALGKTDEAVAAWAEAARVLPDSPEIHHDLGVALLRQGRRAAARKEFKTALRLQPNFPPSLKALRELK